MIHPIKCLKDHMYAKSVILMVIDSKYTMFLCVVNNKYPAKNYMMFLQMCGY